MAKVNKSQAIRDYLKVHPNAMPRDIAAELKGRGIKVSGALISSVKYGGKKTAKASTQRITAEDLVQVKQLADKLGGIGHVKSAVDILERLT